MNLKDLYINFFISKGHKQIPSAPVIPENDPSVLFNTAGMQPLIPYLMGQLHPYGKRLVDYQKCVRTNDLDSIGDTYKILTAEKSDILQGKTIVIKK